MKICWILYAWLMRNEIYSTTKVMVNGNGKRHEECQMSWIYSSNMHVNSVYIFIESNQNALVFCVLRCCAYIFSIFCAFISFSSPVFAPIYHFLAFVFIIFDFSSPPAHLFIIFFEFLSNFLYPSQLSLFFYLLSTFSHFHKLFALTVYRLCDISLVHQ